MKWIKTCIVAVSLLAPWGFQAAHADMVDPGPPVPKRPAWVQRNSEEETTPLYVYAAVGVAAALIVSLIALRVIRERSSSSASP